MEISKIKIEPVGSGAHEHNYGCPIYRDTEPSIFCSPEMIFQPSWKAQKEGWKTIKADNWFKKFILKFVFGTR